MPANPPLHTQPVASLGRPLQEFHLRRAWLARWGNLMLAFLGLAGAAAVLAFGAYQAYLFYYQFGPAIVWKTVEFPLFLVIVLTMIGLSAARAAYLNWRREVTLYENGFTYQDRRGIQTWQWSAVKSYQILVYRNYAAFFYTGDTHRCLLANSAGLTLTLDDDLEGAEQLINKIRIAVYPRLYVRLMHQLQSGKTLEFGALRVNLAQGIEYRQKLFSLEVLESVTTTSGSLKMTLKNRDQRKTIKLSTAQLPNLDILLAILTALRSDRLKPGASPAR